MEQQHQHSKRKRKPVFVFGNYKNYYGYRIGQDLQEDPRLNVFKKELFEDKECLDIGCNSGIITILIAKKFRCRSILGIDIDSDRIEDANWHLKKFERAGKTHAKASKLEVSRSANGSEQSVAASPNEEMMEISRDCSSTETNLFHVVSFQQENFVQSRCPPEKKYDTILCLSVTKWVHLNWGDDGLITLFSKIWRLLRPGGVLVLEPQPWKSYENNRLVSETTAMNYRSILFRPAKFQEILLDKIGFRKVEDITSHLSGSKAGFNRPILGCSENLDEICSYRLRQCGSPSCTLGMRWDGITISLASRLHKAMIRGEANFIKYEVHFVHVFTLLVFSSWEQCEQ